MENKSKKVSRVFNSVAKKYDLMNDFMSFGVHRFWKKFTVLKSGVRKGFKVLDVASGTADLALIFAKKVGETGEVWHTDLNESMLKIGRDRIINSGYLLPSILCDAEKMPFSNNYFDIVVVGFGLRNMSDIDESLKEFYRIIKPGGKLLVLEFSKVDNFFQKPYEKYSEIILPFLGKVVLNDEDSYKYLIESIKLHPDQTTLKKIIKESGFDRVSFLNLSFGIVALHEGIKF